MEIFYADISKNQIITWGDLLNDIAQVRLFHRYCYDDDYYTIFKNIVVSLLLGEDIVLFDSDFGDEEINKLIKKDSLPQDGERVAINEKIRIGSKHELVRRIIESQKKWAIVLFTSGTTGQPKKVNHTFDSITRFAKIYDRFYSDVWGFAYNPTHIAGVQVFFQALLNCNSIIRLFGLKKDEIFNAIENYQVTNISATPTFYRMLLPTDEIFEKIHRITFGGEKFDARTAVQLRVVFPNARFNNVYASTEAGTLFAAEGDVFKVKPSMASLVRIIDHELQIHHSIMGRHELSGVEWYKTGDLVEIVSTDPLSFKFKMRRNEMINVGGYKVNPVEVEEVIREMAGIVDVRVFAKRNSVIGQIICCDIVKNDISTDELAIRSYLQTKLQEYKIPRVIKFVKEISLTRSGKIKRTEK